MAQVLYKYANRVIRFIFSIITVKLDKMDDHKVIGKFEATSVSEAVTHLARFKLLADLKKMGGTRKTSPIQSVHGRTRIIVGQYFIPDGISVV